MGLNVFGILGLVFLFIAAGNFIGGEGSRGSSFLALGIVFLVFFGLKKKRGSAAEDAE
ncbi:hypothetical protein [Aurantiacibacter odishensis]|uniref:hypothetical protein n=1 Tax=Aurantiacibacter odishensis TaxID=1155476 RepID=UPI0013C45B10|nr:hypothetical protein [Aurantiacibacter odishensis]